MIEKTGEIRRVVEESGGVFGLHRFMGKCCLNLKLPRSPR
jgi:hypothetical protein